jgi:hypothetical protein
MSLDDLVERFRQELVQRGWAIAPSLRAEGMARFAHLIPAPDATLLLLDPVTDEQAQVALHFASSPAGTSYACTLQRAAGETAVERGRVAAESGAIIVIEVRGNLRPRERAVA